LNGAAGEGFGSASACSDFDRVPASWQAQTQIEPFAVDRFDFPGPRVGAADAMAASECGHARQRHGMRSPTESREKNRAELSGGSARSQGRHSRTEGNVFVPARARHPFSVRTARAETIESDYGGGSCGAAPAPPRREGEKWQTPQPERPAA